MPRKSSNVVPLSRPLDPLVSEVLGADQWAGVGVTCRIAIIGFNAEGPDLVDRMNKMLDEMPEDLADIFEVRARHIKALEQILVLLRLADKRESAAASEALAARGSNDR